MGNQRGNQREWRDMLPYETIIYSLKVEKQKKTMMDKTLYLAYMISDIISRRAFIGTLAAMWPAGLTHMMCERS